MPRPFVMVDVFGEVPYKGNALAVVLDGHDLSSTQMQEVASWMSVAETTFVLPPTHSQADYRVRIFTPTSELPFAGHPTLGTAHAWLAHHGRALRAVVQECGVGLVNVEPRGGSLAFAAPSQVRTGPVDGAYVDELTVALGLSPSDVLDAQWVDNGPGWVALLLTDVPTLRAVRPGQLQAFVGVAAFCPPREELAYEVRAFNPGPGARLVEDPVTGSLNASLAQWLVGTGRAVPPYEVGQGASLGRRGRIRIDEGPAGTIWVGGQTRTLVSGTLDL